MNKFICNLFHWKEPINKGFYRYEDANQMLNKRQIKYEDINHRFPFIIGIYKLECPICKRNWEKKFSFLYGSGVRISRDEAIHNAKKFKFKVRSC